MYARPQRNKDRDKLLSGLNLRRNQNIFARQPRRDRWLGMRRGFMRLLFLDTETTGLYPAADRWIEVAAIEAVVSDIDVGLDVTVGWFSTLIAGALPLPVAVQSLTGIDNKSLLQAPAEHHAVTLVGAALCRVDAVVCWNAAFDRAFVHAAFARCGVAFPTVPWWCALAVSRKRRPDLRSHRLIDVAAVLGIDPGRSHRAMEDARTTLAVWRALHPIASSTTGTTGSTEAEAEPAQGSLALFR